MVKLVLAGFLAAHGLIHASFLSPVPPATAGGPPWPFDMAKSWLVTRAGLDAWPVTLLGTALVALTVIGFAGSALGAAGWIVPAELWRPLVAGSVADRAAADGLLPPVPAARVRYRCSHRVGCVRPELEPIARHRLNGPQHRRGGPRGRSRHFMLSTMPSW
jgi:hypothetical protein